MKLYTDLEQSKKLTEILPEDSADMTYDWAVIDKEYSTIPYCRKPIDDELPCWSLAALLDALPEVNDNKPAIFLNDNSIIYPYVSGLSAKADNLVDACVEMIIKLHEKGLMKRE